MLLALVGSLLLMAASPQRLLLQVTVPRDLDAQGITVELERLGQVRELRLVDDGSVSADLPGDGVWCGWDEGAYARTLPVRLWLWSEAEAKPQLVYAGTENTEAMGLVRVGWTLQRTGERWEAWRSAAVAPGTVPAQRGATPLVAAFGWGLAVFAWVGWLALAGRRLRS